MSKQNPEDIKEKIRLQYDTAPYLGKSIEETPSENIPALMLHSLVTPYYLTYQKVVDTEGKCILDAGCGSGFKSLLLAFANPGAKIVGIDISSRSIELAHQRLQHHGFNQAEFHTLAIEDVPSLGMTFDYINCDEVLYLTPDPAASLQAMASVLKPDGIIRTNLHSRLQRVFFYRAQEAFRIMNLTEGDVGELEVELVKQVMNSLSDKVHIKRTTWKGGGDGFVRMNYLLQGDQGFTVPEMFEMLQAADMEFVSMVNWQQWDLMSLFQDPDDLPPFLAMSLPSVSQVERLYLFELLHPIHRLLDFWCVKQGATKSLMPIGEWSDDRWQSAWVHLHPQLKTANIREDLVNCIRQCHPWQPDRYAFSAEEGSTYIDSSSAACLLPLWQGKQPFTEMVENWLTLYPVDRITLKPTDPEIVAEKLKNFLIGLNEFPYLLIETEE